jgi:hypothetical protein
MMYRRASNGYTGPFGAVELRRMHAAAKKSINIATER